MSPKTIVGIILILFVYQGITYTREEKILDLGPVEMTKE